MGSDVLPTPFDLIDDEKHQYRYERTYQYIVVKDEFEERIHGSRTGRWT